jgi:hypothetical protein
MKCKKIRVEGLRNEEWFQFYTEFKALVEQYGAQTLDIDALFSAFVLLYADADEALEIISKSATTEQLAEADNKRDTVFRGFADAVKSALNHFNADKRDAAKRIQVILDHYGNVVRKLYDEETASIYNMLQDLQAKAADIELLGLADWLEQLNADNQAFDALMKSRYDETAAITTLRMKNVRVEADRCYRDILDRLDALMIVNGEQAYELFVRALAVRVERFDNILAQRQGRAKAK